MKYLKIFESWSQEYTYDFTDRGFEVEEGENSIVGRYKGKFLMTELTEEFAEMISKLSDEYYILKVQNYFNQSSGNASFNIEVSDKFIENSDFISFKTSSGDVDFYPTEVIDIKKYTTYGDRKGIIIYLNGRLKSGTERLVSISINGDKISVNIRTINKKCTLNLEEAKKLFTIIENGNIPIRFTTGYKVNNISNEELNKTHYPEWKKSILEILK